MIQLRGITKRFDGTTVLDGLDLDITDRHIVTIIGPSGSGKSTLLRIIDGLEPPESGSIRFTGDNPRFKGEATQESDTSHSPLEVDLANASAGEIKQLRSRVGFVFQNYNLFANKTVLQNVTEGLIYAQGMSKSQANKLALEQLDRVGMADFADRHPSTLSGGQQQRVGIARAIALDPDLLVLDEPTSALDPEMVGGVLQTIAQLAHEGMTMLMATHEMRFARDASHHMVFVEHGHIVEQGAPEQLFDHPEHPRTAEFLSSFVQVGGVPGC